MRQPMNIVLLGGGGHGSDVLGLIEDLDRISDVRLNVVAVADDYWKRKDRFQERGIALVHGLEQSYHLATHFIATVGYPAGRMRVAEKAQQAGLESCIPLVHPLANLGPQVAIGRGSIVLGLSSFSPGATIGDHCYISHGVLIGHNTEIAAFTSVMPGASVSGDVIIGTGALIGAGAVITEGITIGENAVVGAGAVVVKNVAPGVLVTGVPARPQK